MMLITEFNFPFKRTCYDCQRRKGVRKSIAYSLRKRKEAWLKRCTDEEIMKEVMARGLQNK